MKSRHEPVPQPEGQSRQQASAPRNPALPSLFFQAAGVTFQLPREGRRACLSVVCSLLLFSLLSFSRAGFQGVVWKQGLRSGHTPAIRGVSRGGCAASPCSGKVPPRLKRAVAPRAHGADPSTAHLFRYPFSTHAVGTFLAVFAEVLGLWFLASSCRKFGKTRS